VQIFGLQSGDVDVTDEEIRAHVWRVSAPSGHHDTPGRITMCSNLGNIKVILSLFTPYRYIVGA
jgi:hypothetical protein